MSEHTEEVMALHAVIAEAKAMLAGGADDHDGRAYAILSAVDSSVLREHDERVKAETIKKFTDHIASLAMLSDAQERTIRRIGAEAARIEGSKTDDHE